MDAQVDEEEGDSYVDKDGAHWIKQVVPTPTQSSLEAQLADAKVLFKQRLGSVLDDAEDEDEEEEKHVDEDGARWVKPVVPPMMASRDAQMVEEDEVDNCVDEDGAHWVRPAVPPPTMSSLEVDLAEVKSPLKETLGSDVTDVDGQDARPAKPPTVEATAPPLATNPLPDGSETVAGVDTGDAGCTSVAAVPASGADLTAAGTTAVSLASPVFLGWAPEPGVRRWLAAVRLQCAFRGHLVRGGRHDRTGGVDSARWLPAGCSLRPLRTTAATAVQAAFRGWRVRSRAGSVATGCERQGAAPVGPQAAPSVRDPPGPRRTRRRGKFVANGDVSGTAPASDRGRGSHPSAARWLPAERRDRLQRGGVGGGDDKAALVYRVKRWQRRGEGEKDLWWSYCSRYGGTIFDPDRHDPHFLSDFLQLAEGGGTLPMGGGDDKAALVYRVKQWQRRGETEKDLWWSYCSRYGGATHDPDRHAPRFLGEFLRFAEGGGTLPSTGSSPWAARSA